MGDSLVGLPGWVQAIASVAVFLVAIFFAVQGYVKKSGTPTTQPRENDAILQAIGGSLADRYAMKDLSDAIRAATIPIGAIAAASVLSTEEMVRLRKCLEDALRELVEENSRLREEAAEIRKRLPLKG